MVSHDGCHNYSLCVAGLNEETTWFSGLPVDSKLFWAMVVHPYSGNNFTITPTGLFALLWWISRKKWRFASSGGVLCQVFRGELSLSSRSRFSSRISTGKLKRALDLANLLVEIFTTSTCNRCPPNDWQLFVTSILPGMTSFDRCSFDEFARQLSKHFVRTVYLFDFVLSGEFRRFKQKMKATFDGEMYWTNL